MGHKNISNAGYTLISIIMHQIDYEEEVEQLQRVWREIKSPKKKASKQNNDSTQTRTNESKVNQNAKKLRVVVSDQNLKRTIKRLEDDFINVVTNPQKKQVESIRSNINQLAPEILLLTNPERQTLIQTEDLRRMLAERDQELSLLRVSNSRNEDRIRQLEAKIEEKESKIQQLRGRERELSNQLSALASKDLNFNYGKVEYQNYRHDSRRLLKILKTTTQYRYFADFALQDDGVRFLTKANKTVKAKLDAPADQAHFHFCSCNKAFIPEPFLWVPEKIYEYGRDFLREQKGEIGQNELQLLLYELNKIWREREKTIVNKLTAEKTNEIAKLKRRTHQVRSKDVGEE